MLFGKFAVKVIRRLIALYNREERKKKEYLLLSMTNSKNIPFFADGYTITGYPYIEIGNNFHAERMMRLEAIDTYGEQRFNPKIHIGNNVHILDYCHIGCIESVDIGDGTLIGSKVLIIDHSHGSITKTELNIRPLDRLLVSKPIKIGKNNWIGDGVCILPGVTLGDNVVVGANSVVTKSFGSNVVLGGSPAKIIRSV